MAEIRGKVESTDFCPYCNEGRLSKNSFTNVISCPICGAYFDRGILYKKTTSPTSKTGSQSFRLRKWQQRARIANAAERNLAFALSELERISAANNLSTNAKEYAVNTYRKAVAKNLVRGRSTDSIVAASVYSACRSFGIPRTLDEISESTGVSKKELGRTYRFISKGLGMNILPAKPQEYIPKYCNTLGLTQKTRGHAIDLLEQADKRELLSGLGPAGVAAGAIYISAHLMNEHRSQSEVAIAADISEVTLRCRYKKLAEGLGIDLEL